MVEAAGIETCAAFTESLWFRALSSAQGGGVRPEWDTRAPFPEALSDLDMASAPKEVVMLKSIRTPRIAVFLIAIPVIASPSLAASESQSKPNIVLVLMDNFGYGEVGVYG